MATESDKLDRANILIWRHQSAITAISNSGPEGLSFIMSGSAGRVFYARKSGGNYLVGAIGGAIWPSYVCCVKGISRAQAHTHAHTLAYTLARARRHM